MTETGSTVEPPRYRVAPRAWIGIVVALAYLAIVIAATLPQGDGPEEGTAAWAFAFQALPMGLGVLMLVIVTSILGWWRPVLFEGDRKRLPGWLWIVPAVAVVAAVYNFFAADLAAIPGEVLLSLAFGTVFVAVGEELAFRGVLLVGLRDRFGEWMVWFLTSLIFGSAHLTNLAFGADLVGTLGQVLFAFVVGTSYYVTRRVSGTLIVPIVLHWMWDYAGLVSAV